jgi:hypothetical protein
VKGERGRKGGREEKKKEESKEERGREERRREGGEREGGKEELEVHKTYSEYSPVAASFFISRRPQQR